jgi:hypothetical protein
VTLQHNMAWHVDDHSLSEVVFSPSVSGEADCFFQCLKCKTWMDCRNLAELIAHEAWCTDGKNRHPMPGRGSQ